MKTLIGLIAFAVSLPAGDVTYIEADKVAAAFEKGMPLLENGSYKIHASRRERPGEVEVHTRDTDIVYVLGGSATLVTGGAPRDSREIAPEEMRAASVDGGRARTLRKGDVVVIPNGVPHWFREVSAPFTYYVVKVRQEAAQ